VGVLELGRFTQSVSDSVMIGFQAILREELKGTGRVGVTEEVAPHPTPEPRILRVGQTLEDFLVHVGRQISDQSHGASLGLPCVGDLTRPE
jgi:hypothetical protein